MSRGGLPDGVVGTTTRSEAGGVKITVGFDACGEDTFYIDDGGTPEDPSDDVIVTVHDPRLQYFVRWSKKGGNADLRAHSPESLDANMQAFFGVSLTAEEWQFLADAPALYPCTE